MSYYFKLGEIPRKRHTQFRQPDGSLYKEELVSSEGFSGIYSNLYHKHAPTRIIRVGEPVPMPITKSEDYKLSPVHLKTSTAQTRNGDPISGRVPLMFNNDLVMGICLPLFADTDYFYKNGEADEILFIHEGRGELISQFGVLPFEPGDYIVIPRTTIYKMQFQKDVPPRFLYIEAMGPVETVKRYRNELGQLMEHSPYCERDIRGPQYLAIDDTKGEHTIKVKKQGFMHSFVYETSPLDVVGWDGFLYPYCLSIHDFEPITGRLHLPPPIHQTFQANGFVVCSFVPRLFDYHPLSIPAPYNHSNIDSDEVLYYVEGNFMSRKGIDVASFTLHPGGLPHGPHPGTVEASIGAKETHELAVMVDTFKPLFLTTQAMEWNDGNYPYSWM
ncbi:MAG: homogentisate 1,2-dioxygenase [Flexibacteraceae bacterium]|jgi:homogentisate 1,2-dioxygenase